MKYAMLIRSFVSQPSGDNRLIADSSYAGQAELTPGDRWMVWRDRQGPVRVTELRTLAAIDAVMR